MIYLIIPNLVFGTVVIKEWKRKTGQKTDEVVQEIQRYVKKNSLQNYVIISGKLLEKHTW